MTTAFGVPLIEDERVVFSHVPAPVPTGERVFLLLLGVLLIPAIFGLFIMIYALKKQSDRAWFVTNRRVVNVSAKNVVTEVDIARIALAARRKSSSSIEFRYGVTSVSVPLTIPIHGMHMLEFARNPSVAEQFPAVSAPP